MTSSTGVYQRHLKACTQTGSCKCPWEAKVFNRHTGKRVSKGGFKTKGEAARWKREKETAIDKGHYRTTTKKTVAEACDELLAGMKDGSILMSGGKRYRWQSIVQYDIAMRLRIIPKLGGRRIADLERPAVQRFVDSLVMDGYGASTISGTMSPLKVVYKRALRYGEIHTADPTRGIQLPHLAKPDYRIAYQDEAAALIAALPESDQGIWATAAHAGLRASEIRGLTWDRIDHSTPPTAWIVVDRQLQPNRDQFTDVKTAAGNRRVPILDVLLPFIERQWERTGGVGFVFPNEWNFHQYPSDDEVVATFERFGQTVAAKKFGCAGSTLANRVQRIRDGGKCSPATRSDRRRPWDRRTVTDRARRAWKEAGLTPIKMHECRHTFASMLFLRGVPGVYVKEWMGHESLQTTLDIYTHLIPGSELDAVAKANAPLVTAPPVKELTRFVDADADAA